MSDKLTTDLHFGLVPRWVARHPHLSAHAVRLYAVLADHADKQGASYPHRSTLARECNTGPKTIDRALRLLIAHAALSVEHRPGKSSVFTVHRSPPEGMPSRTARSVDTGDQGLSAGVSTRVTLSVDTGDETSLDTGVPHKKTHSEEDPLRTPVHDSKQKHDALWDEFERLFGTPVGGAKARYHFACLNALDAGITPDQLEPAKNRYKDAWNVDCNPQALINHWHHFGPEAHQRNMPRDVREALRKGAG